MGGGDLGILEWLMEQSGAAYLSDLRLILSKREAKGPLARALERIPAQRWSTKEWGEAAHYLTDVRQAFSSQSEARDFLIGELKR